MKIPIGRWGCQRFLRRVLKRWPAGFVNLKDGRRSAHFIGDNQKRFVNGTILLFDEEHPFRSEVSGGACCCNSSEITGVYVLHERGVVGVGNIIDDEIGLINS